MWVSLVPGLGAIVNASVNQRISFEVLLIFAGGAVFQVFALFLEMLKTGDNR